MTSIKRILYLFAIIALLAMSPGGGADQANFPDIYIDGATGGDGSLATPYSDFASINWTTGGDNSVFDAVAAGKDVTINLKKGVTWREQMTVGASGSAAHPVTVQAYGEGADPIINGADVITGWEEGIWWTTWSRTLDSRYEDTGNRDYRCVVVAGTDYNGSKIRVTIPAYSGGNFVVDGTSIGLMTTADDMDDAPNGTFKRITWDGGNSGTTITAGSEKVSDEITFDWITYLYSIKSQYEI